ncbi:hypothetical protein [Streptomyces yangpuensis]|uniref:hypothetical protein n=1 Tax=Streptomyces yangpuensis TaxID=1648182 RepID=UPI0037111CF6
MTRTNSGVRWVHAVPIAIGLAVGIWMFHAAVPRLITQLTGVEGRFSAERCVWGEPDSRGDRTMTCRGSFTAADGSFTLPGIAIDGFFDERPQEPVAARADGSEADRVVQTDILGSLAPMGLGLTAFAFPAWALTAAARDALSRTGRPTA